MTCYLGIGVQTWVFGDKTDPKPPFFDLVYSAPSLPALERSRGGPGTS